MKDDKTAILDVRKLSHLRDAQAEQRSACFIVLSGSQAGRMHKIEGREAIIGRAPEAAIRIEDDGVSRQHAQIVHIDGGVAIRDLGSTNGTYCNGEPISLHHLRDGDKIQIGTTTILKFSYQDSQEEEFTRRQYDSVVRDALTSCYNKKYFNERLPSEFAFARRHGKPVALIMFDVDHFKSINDTHGHQAGDYVLRLLAYSVQETVRTPDVLARYGGEEFALIMRETDADAAFIAAERIRRKIESTRFDFEGTVIDVTVSLGIGIAPGKGIASPGELVKATDAYLYRAKGNGRNRTECALLE